MLEDRQHRQSLPLNARRERCMRMVDGPASERLDAGAVGRRQ